MALILRTLTGGTTALAIWLLADGVTLVQVKMTQAEYDTWGSKGTPPNSPGAGAIFLMAMGGIPALNTADGFAHASDAWIDVAGRPMIATSDNADIGYTNLIASDPGITKQSTVTGLLASMSGNRFMPSLLDAQTLATFDVTTIPKIQSVTPVNTIIPNTKSVTFDATASGTGTGATLTIAGTVTSNANSYIASFADCIFTTISGATWNSVSLTQRATVSVDANTPCDMEDLVAPGSGSHNLVYTFGAGVGESAGFISAYGVNQTTPRRTAPVTNTGNSASPTTGNITSAIGDLGISSTFWRGPNTNTPDGTWTNDWNSGASFDPASAGRHIAGAATVSRTDAITSAAWATIAVSLQAAFNPGWAYGATKTVGGVF